MIAVEFVAWMAGGIAWLFLGLVQGITELIAHPIAHPIRSVRQSFRTFWQIWVRACRDVERTLR